MMATDPGCKIDLAIEKYGLESADPMYESIHEGMLERWKGSGDRSAMGYRSLTEWFNKRLLKRVYDEHGRESLGARIDGDYETLRGDDIEREEIVESLRADGIDADAVRADMVSWGTMRTHLQECLDGEKASPTADTDWERESVAKARDVARKKTEKALSALVSKGEIDGVESPEVEVGVQVRCGACPTRVPFDVAYDRGYVCEQHGRAGGAAD